ncbi:serine/threonine protein kinase [bacterium]|nr:serine/threonine protein kinase [candidate division CSSED10-310 bacterium]
MPTEYTSEWKPGKEIMTHYRVVRKLGRGGGGTVYLVVHVTDPSRQYAAKVLNVRPQEGSMGHLLSEIRLWMDLPDHPNITACRFFRTIEGQTTVFAEYIQGGSLKSWIGNRKMMTAENILDIAIQLGWGLHVAHQMPLVHQDIKPANILMTSDRIPKLTDFGLAAYRNPGKPLKIDQYDNRTVYLTSRGMTPAYCSPEQASGQKISRKTDIWSYGLTILEMFTGPHRWKFGFTAPMVLEEVIRSGTSALGFDFPKSMTDILKRCFMEDPADRWKHVKQIVNALIAVYESRFNKPYPRSEPAVKAVSDTGKAFTREHIQGEHWQSPGQWMEIIRKKGGTISHSVKYLVTHQRGSYRARLLMDLEIYEELEKSIQDLLAQNSKEIMLLYHNLLYHKTLILDMLQDYQGILFTENKITDVFTTFIVNDACPVISQHLAKSYLRQSASLHRMSDHEASLTLIIKAEKILNTIKTLEPDLQISNDQGRLYQNKGVILGSQARYDEAEKAFLMSIHILTRKVKRNPDNIAVDVMLRSYQNLAFLYKLIGRFDDADSLLKEALDMVGKPKTVSQKIVILHIMQSLAENCHERDDNENALIHYQKVLDHLEKLKSSMDDIEYLHQRGIIHGNLAMVYYRLGKMGKSFQSIDLAIGAFTEMVVSYGLEDRSYNLSVLYRRKAMVLFDQERYAETVECCDEADRVLGLSKQFQKYPLLKNELAHRAFYRGYALLKLGDAFRSTEELAEAVRYYSEFAVMSPSEVDEVEMAMLQAMNVVSKWRVDNDQTARKQVFPLLSYLEEQYAVSRKRYLEKLIQDIYVYMGIETHS